MSQPYPKSLIHCIFLVYIVSRLSRELARFLGNDLMEVLHQVTEMRCLQTCKNFDKESIHDKES